MSKAKSKAKARLDFIRPRNIVVIKMIQETKNQVFSDRKKQASRGACRKPIKFSWGIELDG